jgi:hypothetical protein
MYQLSQKYKELEQNLHYHAKREGWQKKTEEELKAFEEAQKLADNINDARYVVREKVEVPEIVVENKNQLTFFEKIDKLILSNQVGILARINKISKQKKLDLTELRALQIMNGINREAAITYKMLVSGVLNDPIKLYERIDKARSRRNEEE